MVKEFDLSEFEALAKSPEVPREAAIEAFCEVAGVSPEVRSKSARELADEYSVSDRTIQT